ncbi:modular serine protease-like [Rhagoletis pomonella]|uniref:modular serine protease-like n=1 Tax=Rhagoletis pomonella TaxID=28610 RepID=UPI001783F81B|nr:modular serine protease-like [Rhagoletis pomonella]
MRSQSMEDDFFPCKNGYLIPYYKVCDGYKDCSDGSDEFEGNSIISSPCLEEECSNLNARCHYGACIPLETWCNGISDCADGSDEWKLNCNKNNNPDELSCESGEFIPKEWFCDGKADCEDSSDESESYCSLKQCEEFRCKYGGCIANDRKCNGKKDCIDGSDENMYYASCPAVLSPVTRIRLRLAAAVCKITYDANHDIRNDNENVHLTPGSSVDVETRITIKCKNNSTLSTNTAQEVRICGRNGWDDEIPKCLQFCNADLLMRSRSTIADCKRYTERVPCERIEPNTVAVISCADGYHMPNGLDATFSMMCRNDGRWNKEKVNCRPSCGKIEQDPTSSKAPWHVRIKAQSINVCGGTILSTNLVITALHCVFDENEEVLDANYVQVVAAKRFENNTIVTHTKNVSNIYANRSVDVVLLKLSTPYILSKNIRPICHKFTSSSGNTVNKNANVHKWPTRSAHRGQIEFPKTAVETLSGRDCNAQITADQFCVRPTSNWKSKGADLCQGDSGSGVVERRNGRWHLIGIISAKPSHGFICTREPVAAVDLTEIPEMLQQVIEADVEAKYDAE